MGKKLTMAVVVVALVGLWVLAGTASAEDVLTGDARLACEALLCLSSPSPPSECGPALSRYYSIRGRKASDTRRKRQEFLDKCPRVSATPEMQSLVSASAGSGSESALAECTACVNTDEGLRER
jgi:hypothetical protein